mgnify:CR=1 FL=1
MSKRRVVVTGLGLLTPVGNSVETSWEAIQAGKSGISNIEHFDTEKFACKFAGMVKDFNVEDYMPKKEARKMDVFIQYGVAAADQAFCDGLNWICFHTFTHRPSITDVPGLTHSAGTHFDRTTTWWNQSAPFVTYLSRCSFMLQEGRFAADVLFYKGHGLRTDADAFEWKDGMKNPPASLGTGYDYDSCN